MNIKERIKEILVENSNTEQELVNQIVAGWGESTKKGYQDQAWYPISVTINNRKILFMVARKFRDKVDRYYLKTLLMTRILKTDTPEMMWNFSEIVKGQYRDSNKLPKPATEQEIKDFKSKA